MALRNAAVLLCLQVGLRVGGARFAILRPARFGVCLARPCGQNCYSAFERRQAQWAVADRVRHGLCRCGLSRAR